MSITHEEARRLIQFKVDGALYDVDLSSLESHLSICLECQKYAASIEELESTLPLLLHRRWNQTPLPRSVGQVALRKSVSLKQSIFFATRIIAMSVLCITFLFNIWQSTQSGRHINTPPSAQIPMIPTPSLQSTVAKPADQKCAPTLYEVRQSDTLDSIARQFSVSVEDIQRVNQLRSATLTQHVRLAIPVCSATPLGTPYTSVRTFAPLPGTTTLTPLDSPTQ